VACLEHLRVRSTHPQVPQILPRRPLLEQPRPEVPRVLAGEVDLDVRIVLFERQQPVPPQRPRRPREHQLPLALRRRNRPLPARPRPAGAPPAGSAVAPSARAVVGAAAAGAASAGFVCAPVGAGEHAPTTNTRTQPSAMSLPRPAHRLPVIYLILAIALGRYP